MFGTGGNQPPEQAMRKIEGKIPANGAHSD
jgi:hypothetical protein